RSQRNRLFFCFAGPELGHDRGILGFMWPRAQLVLKEALPAKPSPLPEFLRELKKNHCVSGYHYFPAREPRFADFPDGLDLRLRQALERRGILNLYTHQAEAFASARSGKNVVIVTPTASGKTLCYNLPVLQRILENPDARALCLYPTKALTYDQLDDLMQWANELDEGSSISVYAYDGDTPQDARSAVRSRGHIVLSNPDMLHKGVLPHHTKWTRLFENLQFIVLDELHTYRGVFGSHLANLLRRVARICQFYGSNPQFICTSATI